MEQTPTTNDNSSTALGFKVGDRVRLTKNLSDLLAGQLGTVKHGLSDLGVKFDGAESISVRRREDDMSYRILDYCELISAPAKPIHAKPQLYAYYFLQLKEIAMEFGYNLLVHGSMNRDLDLIAVPWGSQKMNG